MRAAGNANAPRIGNRLKSRRDIHTVAEYVTPVDYNIPDIDANPEFDALVVADGGVPCDHAALDIECASAGVDDARKFDEHAIAGGLYDAPAVLDDCWIDEIAAMPLQPCKRAFFVEAHQPAVIGNVRRQNCR